MKLSQAILAFSVLTTSASSTSLRGGLNAGRKLAIDYTGAVEYYNGQGGDPECGIGCGWNELHDDGWTSGGTAIAASWTPDINPRIVYGLADGTVQYYDSSQWSEIMGSGWNSAIASIQAQFHSDSTTLALVGLADGAIEYYDSTAGWTEYQGTEWQSSANFLAVNWPFENSYNGGLRFVVGLADGSVQFYDGQGSWKELKGNPGISMTSMQVYFSDNNFWPAVVQGNSDGSVDYYDSTSGSWSTLAGSGWGSAVNKMEVMFPDQNSQGDLKVVVGLADGAVEYYDGTGWSELHDSGWSSSTNGLCASFSGTDNSVTNIEVVQGLGNGAVEYFSDGGWNELLASGTEGIGGIANIQCSFDNGMEMIATYTNAPVNYYQLSTGNWTNLAGGGWNNQMSQFSTDFSVPGEPRLVGGLYDMLTNEPGWLECKICTSAVGTLFDDSEEVCDATCVAVVEAAGGGPEDPVADFVAAVCIPICEKIVSKVESTTEQDVCEAVNMCSQS